MLVLLKRKGESSCFDIYDSGFLLKMSIQDFVSSSVAKLSEVVT